MKKRNFSQKLYLNKQTVSRLQDRHMNLVKAGATDPTIAPTCDCVIFTYTACRTICPDGPYCI